MILANSNHYKVAIFGDSRHVIYKMLNGYTTGLIKCRRLYNKAVTLLSPHYEFYHILRTNNVISDELENVGASLPQGHLQLNGANPPLNPFHNEPWLNYICFHFFGHDALGIYMGFHHKLWEKKSIPQKWIESRKISNAWLAWTKPVRPAKTLLQFNPWRRSRWSSKWSHQANFLLSFSAYFFLLTSKSAVC